MRQFNKLHKIFATRLTVLLAVLFGNAGFVLADNTLSIADFEIKAGETKEVSVELTNTATDIYMVSGTIGLPSGLEIVSYSSTSHCKAATRTNGAFANMNPTTGQFTVQNLSKTAFSGTSGAVATIKVKASQNFITSQIRFADVKVKRIDGTEETVTGKPATVTLAAGQGEDDPDDPTPAEGDNSIAFAKSTVKIAAGGTADVDLKLSNGTEFTSIQGYLTVSNGVSIQDVKISDRLTGKFSYNSERGFFYSLGAITGKTGAILTVTLKAAEDFDGIATLTATEVAASDASATSFDLADATASIVADGVFVPEFTLAFGSESVALAPGESVNVPVTIASNVAFTGLDAYLTLPAGITAEVKKGSALSTTPTFNASNGYVRIFGEEDLQEGEALVLTLTAASDFSADAELSLKNITATTSGATAAYTEDIALTIKANNPADLATVMGWVDGLQQKLDKAIETIETEYPAAAEDEDLLRDEQIIQQGIVDLHGDVQEAYDKGELNPDDFKGTVKELSDAIDDLLYEAKEIQDKEGNKDNEAGKAALDDEIAALQKKLDDAKDAIPSDLPKDATKELSDDADAIQKQIDDLKAQVEQDYKDGKLTPDSKLDPEKKQKVLDDIDALLAKIKTWLRGDVDNDGDVDMDDFYALKKLISEEKTPTDAASNFFYRCDANADGEINVGDLQGILNICVGLKANGK